MSAAHPTRVLIALRERILSGALRAGDRLAEIPVAEMLGVSRTPVRLALAELEREGLVVPMAGGGFAVRAFTLREIEDAIDLRGLLEGMAARLVAEHGLSRARARDLEACLAAGDRALAGPEAGVQAYAEMNTRLHELIVEAAGNDALARAMAQVNALPFASASGLVAGPGSLPDRQRLLAYAHAQHHALVEAVAAGQGARAEALAREHAENARRNLRLMAESGELAPPVFSALVTDIPRSPEEAKRA
jgi:GntR family transcriptional regulator of vanillate catabolism